MEDKVYIYKNLEILCHNNNMTLEQLRTELNMSWLQVRNPNWPKARKKITEYFGVSEEEFLYEDFSIPQTLRFLSRESNKERFLNELNGGITVDCEKWQMVGGECINKICNANPYKQQSFILDRGKYSFLIVFCEFHKGEIESEYKIFEDNMKAYGYLKCDNKFYCFFSTQDNEQFKRFCDDLLEIKKENVKNWKIIDENEREKKEYSRSYCLGKVLSTDDIMKKINIGMMFDDDLETVMRQINKDEEGRIKIIQDALNCIEKLKNKNLTEKQLLETSNGNMKNFVEKLICKKEETGSEFISYVTEIKYILEQEKDELANIIKEKEEKKRKEEKKKVTEESLFEEWNMDKQEIGKWSKKSEEIFRKHINNLSFDEFKYELKIIDRLHKNEEKDEFKNCNDSEFELMKKFLYAKRIYSYVIDRDNIMGIKPDNSIDREYNLLLFRDGIRKNQVRNFLSELAQQYILILVVLYGITSKGLELISKINSICIDEEINIYNFDDILHSLYILNQISDDSEFDNNDIVFDIQQIFELSNAKWTVFFEETDDKVLEDALPYVWAEVNKLFAQNELQLEEFFKKRFLVKRFYPMYNESNTGFNIIGEMLCLQMQNNEFIRRGKKYKFLEGKIYEEGWTSTVELGCGKNRKYAYPIVDCYLATYIIKYMECFLRNYSKYKSKCSYKYWGDYCFEVYNKDEDTPEIIKHDYGILKGLLKNGDIRQNIYVGMEKYFEQHPEADVYWKDRFIKNN